MLEKKQEIARKMGRKKLGYIFATLLFLGSLIQLAVYWDNRADGFKVHKLDSQIKFDERWEISQSDEMYQQALKILQQPFYYLGHGFQCFAFESQDGKYVVKFFRHHRLRLPWIVESLPPFPIFDEWRTARTITLKKRAENLLRSCKVSQLFAPKECALLYTHLNPTINKFPKLEIIDRLDTHFMVDLDRTQFIIQQKAQQVKPTLKSLRNNLDLARSRIRQIFTLLSDCAKRGVQDTDNALIHKNNLGFLEDRAIYIDGGKLALKERIKQKEYFIKDLKRLDPLLKWMEQETPELVPIFHEEKHKCIEEFPEEVPQS
jgi:hypothetical protein